MHLQEVGRPCQRARARLDVNRRYPARRRGTSRDQLGGRSCIATIASSWSKAEIERGASS
jgi:hypothetical protein